MTAVGEVGRDPIQAREIRPGRLAPGAPSFSFPPLEAGMERPEAPGGDR
jgi:hypothetical protein